MPITAEHKKEYQEQGYTIVRELIPPDEVAPLRAYMAEIVDGEHDGEWPESHLHVADPKVCRNPRGGMLITSLQRAADHDKRFAAVCHHPNLVEAMESLLGGPVVKFTDQTLMKSSHNRSPQGGQSFYHQDSYYWHIDPERGCNCWIALDEVGPGAIALGLIPGSHKDWVLADHESYYDDPPGYRPSNGTAFERHRIAKDRVDFSKEDLVPMKPGDGAFFTNYTWHRAEPNHSGEHKFAYAIAYELAAS